MSSQVRVDTASTGSKDISSPHFISRLIELAAGRLNESIWTRLFTIVVVVQAILAIVFEALILYAHSSQNTSIFRTDNATFQDYGWNATHYSPGATQAITSPGGYKNTTGADPYQYPEDRLTRLQYENIFFMCFQIWQLYFGVDSIVRQNLIQAIAHCSINFLCVIFAGVQISESLKWKKIVSSIDAEYQVDPPTDLSYFSLAVRYEIILASCLFFFVILLALFTWKLYKQFGWNIYKRIGADVVMQNMFRIYQIFVILIKIDAFFQLVLAIFWLVVMAETEYLTLGDTLQKVWFGVHTAITALNIPALFLARIAIKNENSLLVVVFVIFEIVLTGDFCIIIQQSSSQWGFWVFAVCVAIIFSIITSIYVIVCTGNFNKGLKPHIQRMFDVENYLNSTTTGKATDWQIDDISRGPSMIRKSGQRDIEV